MSYILDALKRADAERQLGTVPGLHVQQVSKSAQDAASSAASRRWATGAWLAGFAALIVGGAALVYRGFSVPAPTQNTVPVPVAVSPPAIRQPPASPQPPLAKAKPIVQANPATKIETPLTKTEMPVPKPTDVPKLNELPEDIRRQILPLTINGSVYSDSPAHRMLVVNNLVQTQGSQIKPDLKLEEIGAKSSVFSYAGTRFRVSH